MISRLQKKYALSDQGAKDLLKAIIYSVLANISLMLPVALLAVVLNAMLPVVLGTEEKITVKCRVVWILCIGIHCLCSINQCSRAASVSYTHLSAILEKRSCWMSASFRSRMSGNNIFSFTVKLSKSWKS